MDGVEIVLNYLENKKLKTNDQSDIVWYINIFF